MTALSRDALALQLDAVAGALPQLLADCPDPADFWPAFAGMTDVIEDQAGPHAAYVRERIDAMLLHAGVRDTATLA